MLRANVKKPFPGFKWRWASFQPSEGLNEPPVFLGVLRALNDNTGQAANSQPVFEALKAVETDLQGKVSTSLNLARDRERNLLRNSQQYWSALGVLAHTQPSIGLTKLGQDLASGDTTVEEFAAAVVKSLTLPNIAIETTELVSLWRHHGISTKPLALILEIVLALHATDPDAAFLSNEQLTKVVIPLSSLGASVPEHVEHLIAFRADASIVDSWDDFVPAANDKRMSREFLLFLYWHGFLSRGAGANYRQKFRLEPADRESIAGLLSLPLPNEDIDTAASEISRTGEVGTQERVRRQVSVLGRPQQARFRKDVLDATDSKCMLTGETMLEVLTACHIIPVSQNGSDDVGNGLCLREDLHILFDSGHLRIHPTGTIHLSSRARTSATYSKLPNSITLPGYIETECLRHRWKYQG